MSASIAFSVKMEPVSKGRPRFLRSGIIITPASTRKAEATIRQWAKIAICERGLNSQFPIKKPNAVSIRLNFVFQVPKSWPKAKKELVSDSNCRVRHTCRPDLDNLTKTVLDALNGIVYEDDSQIHQIRAQKTYSPTESFIVVRITENSDEYGMGD